MVNLKNVKAMKDYNCECKTIEGLTCNRKIKKGEQYIAIIKPRGYTFPVTIRCNIKCGEKKLRYILKEEQESLPKKIADIKRETANNIICLEGQLKNIKKIIRGEKNG